MSGKSESDRDREEADDVTKLVIVDCENGGQRAVLGESLGKEWGRVGSGGPGNVHGGVDGGVQWAKRGSLVVLAGGIVLVGGPGVVLGLFLGLLLGGVGVDGGVVGGVGSVLWQLVRPLTIDVDHVGEAWTTARILSHRFYLHLGVVIVEEAFGTLQLADIVGHGIELREVISGLDWLATVA